MKALLETMLSWLAFFLAFFNALMLVNVPIFIVVCSKCDMFESKSLYYQVTMAYFDFLATLPSEGLWLFLGFLQQFGVHSSSAQEVSESFLGGTALRPRRNDEIGYCNCHTNGLLGGLGRAS